jgi:hypothetical protein
MCSCKAFLHARRIRHILLLILLVLIGVEANNILCRHLFQTCHVHIAFYQWCYRHHLHPHQHNVLEQYLNPDYQLIDLYQCS